MHRRFRCPLAMSALLAGGALCLSQPLFAQQDPSSAPVDQTAASPSASTPKNPLLVRVRLGDGHRTYQPSRRQLGIGYAPGTSARTTPPKFVVDPARCRAYLAKLKRSVDRSPVDAHPVVAKASSDDMGTEQVPARVVGGTPGTRLDVGASVAAIQKAVQQDPNTTHVVLAVKTTPAHVTAAALQGINARIGYFVTHFNPGEVGRTQTVRRAIEIIDGTVVKPGQTFSVNQTVGERTKERGFGEGHVFVDGKMEKQVGGGMCQVATTLFNAAMLADLKIVERHAHVRTIPYAPPGSDATVYFGQKDFKFANNTDAPIYISYRTTRTHAITSLFGKAVPGRKVRLLRTSERLGPRHYRGSITRVVIEPDGTKTRDASFRSSYKWTPALDYSH